MDIHDMKLHESIIIKSETPDELAQYIRVIRVPGGWVYLLPSSRGNCCTFVPYQQTDV